MFDWLNHIDATNAKTQKFQEFQLWENFNCLNPNSAIEWNKGME